MAPVPAAARKEKKKIDLGELFCCSWATVGRCYRSTVMGEELTTKTKIKFLYLFSMIPLILYQRIVWLLYLSMTVNEG